MNTHVEVDFEVIGGPGVIENPAVVEWDAWLEQQTPVHLEQLWVWGQVRRRDGWTPYLLLARRAREIVGGSLLLVRTVSRIARSGYISRGPILGQSDTADAAVTARLFCAKLANVARSLRLVCLTVDLPYPTHPVDLSNILARIGFIRHVQGLPPTGLATGGLVIDLTPAEEDILKGIRRTLRQNIRQGEAGGVTVREGSEADIPTLWKLLEDLCRRRNTHPNVAGPETVQDLWRELKQRGDRVSLHVAEVNGRPEVAVLTVFLGTWAIPWRIGWSGEARHLHPEKVLYWHLIRAAKQRGCTRFDFNWIDAREARGIQDGRPVTGGSQTSGITFFKMGFGGNVVLLSGCYDYFPNRLVRSAMRRFGPSLFSSRLTRELVSAIRERKVRSQAGAAS